MVTTRRIISPTDWVSRQIDTLRSVGQKNYEQGIAAPRKDPIVAGIAAEDRYQDSMRKALDGKHRVKGLEKTTAEEWQGYARNIGAGKLVDGVVKRQAKVDSFVKSFQPMLTEHVSKLDSMPTGTTSDRNAKVIANLEGLRALKGEA